jgi:hypothetical protein
LQDDKPDYTIGGILNKILISRGASKEKYPLEVPTVPVERPEESAPLSIRQQEALSLLDISITDINNYREWEKLGSNEIKQITEKDKNYKRLRKQLIKDISKAIRLGLIWHPLVSDFIYTYKAIGDKELLREIKGGFGTNVKRPLTITDLKFRNCLDEIAELIESKTWPQIRLILLKDKIIKDMSCEALKKKFEKAWEEEWRKFNKKAPLIP